MKGNAAVKMDMHDYKKRYTIEQFLELPDEDPRLELIDGELYDMAEPSTAHQRVVSKMVTLVNNYIDKKGGPCEVLPGPFAVMFSSYTDEKDHFNNIEDSVVSPDISVICDPSKITPRGCTGGPDWVIEVVSPSNKVNDYVRKLSLYSRGGVREYWIVDLLVGRVVVYRFEKGEDEQFMNVYALDQKIPVGIYEDLVIDFSTIA